jgi:predicted AlkP superfamily phosphohydrolase/phosphomutase
LLVLNHYPDTIKPFDQLDINWEKTSAWSEGGYYARVFLNVKGREEKGLIDPGEYEQIREHIKTLFENTTDDQGRSLGTRVYKPEEVYREVRNVAPDLIVHFGDLYWRSIGGVGYPSIHTRENDTGPDGCNHALYGAFILAASNSPIQGEIQNLGILDISPTLLEIAGYEIPSTMQGKSLVDGLDLLGKSPEELSEEEQALLKERLSGLGYIS